MTKGIRQICGQAVVLRQDNINTDQIIPSREMKRVTRKGLGEGLFANLRYLESETGGRRPDPAFALNAPEARDAQILISGANFGCGSSREHAVWALREYGFTAIIAESFGSIFFDNCVANGIVPVVLSGSDIDDVQHHTDRVTVDLDRMQVIYGDQHRTFTLSERQRHMLRVGHSQIDLTLEHASVIAAFRASDRGKRPWIYAAQEQDA